MNVETVQQNYAALRARAEAGWRALENAQVPRILVQLAGCGISVGADRVYGALEREVGRRGVAASVERVGCNGMCYMEPIVEVQLPGGPRVLYGQVTIDRVPELVQTVVQAGKHRPDWAFGVVGDQGVDGIPALKDVPYFGNQVRHVMALHGVIDPENLDHYIAHGGYAAFVKALTSMTREEILAEVNASGLVGRGGAAFPTGRKWETAMKTPATPKYMFCNAEEGEPAIYKDRRILESDPHSVLEGMLIAAIVIGVDKGYVYVGGEHHLAAHRSEVAIQQLYQNGLLGKNILGSDFSLEMEVRVGAGSYAVGESSAMMSSLEGKRGMPRPKLVRSAEKGVWAKPTNMNNVETYANVPRIIRDGGAEFAKLGTAKSKGTKLFAPSGHIKYTGLIEVPFGVPLRHIVFDICGGMRTGRKFKAAQPAGPTGATMPESQLDVPMSNEDTAAAGTVLGSGGLVVFDDSVCIVDFGIYMMQFNAIESCTRCTTCRIGTARLTDTFNRWSRGEGQLEDFDTIRWLGPVMIETTLCGLGQAAPVPAISIVDHFREELEAHILDHRCPAGVCEALVHGREARERIEEAKVIKISV
ncbi:MAG TPA: NADH-ubiquinone oxidoreductase-F iron-sulfur binding region domain-containing protein [Chloroflexota bacterium]|nr:NADH-ubiquinone oxidoreductase-F iron-sulfur binding region domain-containing protein [Chloroflexota bacterium]